MWRWKNSFDGLQRKVFPAPVACLCSVFLLWAAACLKPLTDYGYPEQQQSVGFLTSFTSPLEIGELQTSAGSEYAWMTTGTDFSMGRRRLGKYDTSFGGCRARGLCAATLMAVFSSVQWQPLEGRKLLNFIKMRIFLFRFFFFLIFFILPF